MHKFSLAEKTKEDEKTIGRQLISDPIFFGLFSILSAEEITGVVVGVHATDRLIEASDRIPPRCGKAMDWKRELKRLPLWTEPLISSVADWTPVRGPPPQTQPA